MASDTKINNRADLPAKGLALLKRIKSKSATVGVIGLGYIGLPLAVTAAARGNPVIGFDVDAEKIGLLAAGTSYIPAVSQDALQTATGSGFSWTTGFPACVPAMLS